MLCQYKDLFGKPGEGAHQYRLFNIAVVDVAATVGLAAAIFGIFKMLGMDVSFAVIVTFTFLLGIGAHRLFCVRTTVDKLLFPHATTTTTATTATQSAIKGHSVQIK
jgi:hypothetical protein